VSAPRFVMLSSAILAHGRETMLLRLFALVLLFAGQAAAQTAAIRAGNLVDPVTGTVAKNQVILVKDGKIAEVGPRVQIPAGAEVVDLSNAWVMPGLLDAHTHLTLGGPSLDLLESLYLRAPAGLRVLRGIRNVRAVLEAGFPTITDVGNAAKYA